MPMRRHERVLIFGDFAWHPQKRKRTINEMKRLNSAQRVKYAEIAPDSVLEFDSVNCRSGSRTMHASQKPVELMCYILQSFTDGTILDPFAGSGTTGRAAKDLQRKCTMIELEERYCEIAANRCRQEVLPL